MLDNRSRLDRAFSAEIQRIDIFYAGADELHTRKENVNLLQTQMVALYDSLRVHEMGLYADCRTFEEHFLFSLPDLRQQGSARVLFLVTRAKCNLCDRGCFCTGTYFVSIDVLFPAATDTVLAFAFTGNPTFVTLPQSHRWAVCSAARLCQQSSAAWLTHRAHAAVPLAVGAG